MTYQKSPLNYTGNKYKLLPQILPLFPKEIDTFYDLFCGAATVSINVKAKKIIANDNLKPIIGIHKGIQESDTDQLIRMLEYTNRHFKLNEGNENGYYALRTYYNQQSSDWYLLLMLQCNSFSNMIRFNRQGEFNAPYGKRGYCYNFKENLIAVAKIYKSQDITFHDDSYNNLIISPTPQDFVYCDPPYLLADAAYNADWTYKEEKELLAYLDDLNAKDIKFALSNVMHHKGTTNKLLLEWSKQYKVHHLNYNYNNCNYQTYNMNAKTDEVLVTNYETT
jgi:DNA adenine methylase Dam